MQLTQYITGNQLLSSHVQYQSAISAGGPYRNFSGSFSVNIDLVSQRESFTRRFASSLYTIANGVRIEGTSGDFSLKFSKQNSSSHQDFLSYNRHCTGFTTVDASTRNQNQLRVTANFPEEKQFAASAKGLSRTNQCSTSFRYTYTVTQSHNNVSQ